MRETTAARKGRLPPRLRKLVLAAHVAVSVGWFGLVAAMLVLSINAATAQAVGASGAAYALIDDVSGTLIAPPPASFSIVFLLTGVVLALGTRWGLFEHYWIQTKPLLAVVVILSGTFLVDRWIQQASAIPEGSPPMLLIYASVVHLLMLGAATLISAYEPWGATRRGRRDAKQRRVKRSVNGEARTVPGARASDGADATEAQLEGFDRLNKTPHQRTEAREGNPIDEHSSERSAVGGGLVLLRGGRLIGPLFGLLFLAYPLGALLTSDPSSARLALALCGTALFVGVFLWLLWSRELFRAATAEAPEVRKRRAAVAVLAVLALLLTLVGGGEWLALFVHAGVAAGLVLPGKDAPAAVVGLAVLAVVAGLVARTEWPTIGRFALPMVALCLLMVALARHAATVAELREAPEEIARLAVAEERLRFARDLHDLLGHSPSLIMLKSTRRPALARYARDREGCE